MRANASSTSGNEFEEGSGLVARGLAKCLLDRFPNVVSFEEYSLVMVVQLLSLLGRKPCAAKPNYVQAT